MPRKIVDLSVPLMAGIPSDPPGMTPEIEYVEHDAGAKTFEAAFGIPVDKQIDGKGAAIENLRMTTHSGTHMDAPWHYHPTMNGGEAAWRIDQVPLDWCMGPGVKLDFRSLPDGHVVTAKEVEAELARIGHDLQPGDIVLVNTRAGSRYGEADYVSAGCGMGRAATLWLTERGMRVCGTDAWSWDPPLMSQMEQIKRTGDWSLFWEGHKAGRDTIFCHMEKLGNLETLPSTGFEVIAMPMNIKDASAGFVRPIALIDS